MAYNKCFVIGRQHCILRRELGLPKARIRAAEPVVCFADDHES